MELRHLRYFVAVAETLHFGRAAERLAMAQPPLSQQIKALEREIGVTLLLRTQRRVTLTEAGSVFLEEARRILAAVDRAVVLAQRTARGEIGRLRVGFVSSAAYNVLPEVIRRFRSTHPEAVLELEELTSEVQPQRLQLGEIDVALFRTKLAPVEPVADDLVRETLFQEPFVVALPESHPLVRKKRLTLPQLAGEAFVLFPRRQNPGFYDQIVRLCEQAGFVPHIAQEAILMQTMISLVFAGIGVALVPASMEHLQRQGVVYRPLAEPGARSELMCMWRRADTSPLLHAFAATMREVANQSQTTGQPLQPAHFPTDGG